MDVQTNAWQRIVIRLLREVVHGGVAILWKKKLPAMAISAIQSDRIIGIQLPTDNSTSLAIIGVYLPSSNHPMAESNGWIQWLNT